VKRFLLFLDLIISRLSAFFQPATGALHTARWPRLHELAVLTDEAPLSSSLLLGIDSASRILQVKSTKTRKELGNLGIIGPTRCGKTVYLTALLDNWRGSSITNDIKGEFTTLTSGDKARGGRVFVIDPRGLGNRYDPLQGMRTEDELYSAAKLLMYEPREGDGIAFTQKGIKMLTLLFLAVRQVGERLLPFVSRMADMGLNSAAGVVYSISPNLARRFLDSEYNPTKDYEENKYLANSWESLTARLFPLLTEKVVRTFSGSDFSSGEIITSKVPINVYLRWRESDLLAKAPLVRLIWESIIKGMIDTYDELKGEGCHPVLALLDEFGRTKFPNMPDHATTVCGRGISLVMAYQSDSQLDALYGHDGANILRGNMDTQIYYRPNDQKTADNLEKRLGYTSGWAASESEHEGTRGSTGKSETRVPLLTARKIMELDDETIIGFHRNLPPFRARRMSWMNFPEFAERRKIAPPQIPELPPVKGSLINPQELMQPAGSTWQLSPDLMRRGRPVYAGNGFAKKG
jgi:type IV secretion system protein VirD4